MIIFNINNDNVLDDDDNEPKVQYVGDFFFMEEYKFFNEIVTDKYNLC